MITNTRIPAMLIIAALIITAACGSIKGEFGFKTFYDDGYRKKNDPLEFNQKEEIAWVYSIPKVTEYMKIGVIYLKKEIVWVDVESSIAEISKNDMQVYGKIKDFPAGEYKINLVDISEGNNLIDERMFTIYSDDNGSD